MLSVPKGTNEAPETITEYVSSVQTQFGVLDVEEETPLQI